MTIKLYNNAADPLKVDKELDLTLIATVSGEITQPSSVESPTFHLYSTAVPTCDYVYIQDYNKWYFVNTPPVNVGGNDWSIQCVEDDLMTWKSAIYGVTAFVDRQETDYDKQLPDEEAAPRIVPTRTRYSATMPKTTAYTGAQRDWFAPSTEQYTTDDYRVLVAFNASYFKVPDLEAKYFSPFPLTYVVMKYSQFKTMLETIKFAASSIIGKLSGYSTLQDMLVGAWWCPYVIEGGIAIDKICFYGILSHTEIDDVEISIPGYVIASASNVTTIKSLFYYLDYNEDEYIDAPPYTRTQFEMQPFGNIDIDLMQATVVQYGATKQRRVNIFMTINQITGECVLSGPGEAQKDTLLASCNLLSPIDITKANSNDTSIFQTASGVATVMSSVASGAMGAAAMGAFTLANNLLPRVSYNVQGGSQRHVTIPRVYQDKYDVTVPSAGLVGRPCATEAQLSTFKEKGFTRVKYCHLEGFEGASQSELNRIMQKLKEGVLL